MIYSPKKNNKVNILISFTAIIIFVASVLITFYFGLPKAIWQGTFFVLAIVICELMTKYFLPEYVYSIDSDSFVITKNLGKNSKVICNIDVPRIVALYPNKEYKKQETYSPRNVYSYNGNIVTDSCYVLIFEYSDCTEAVCFEPDAAMVETILSLIKNR